MASATQVVAELVYTSITAPTQQYQHVFQSTLQPIPLAQSGLKWVLGGVIPATVDQDGATVVSLVNWESMDAHTAFVSGPEARTFFEAFKPMMSSAPAIEHHGISLLQTPAVERQYTRLVKATNDSDKQLLESILDKHVASEGAEMAVISDCVEDPSLRLLMLFSKSAKFEAAAEALSGSTSIKSTVIEWYLRGYNYSIEIAYKTTRLNSPQIFVINDWRCYRS